MQPLPGWFIIGDGVCFLAGLFALAYYSRYRYLIFGLLYVFLIAVVITYTLHEEWQQFALWLLVLIITGTNYVLIWRAGKQKSIQKP